ncbi:MAG: glycosyltransferase [Deltaproteobacteria bacterium]|nr:glycosyltransferase [Deltaproteobacteria bacterium]MBW2086005.1 glycosyltransferase [Deltaproteobacteria bacterium]
MVRLKIKNLSKSLKISQAEIKRLRDSHNRIYFPQHVHFQSQSSISRPYIPKSIPQVVILPRKHDYINALYDAMPEGSFIERPLSKSLQPDKVDILHLHFPEHLLVCSDHDRAQRESEYLKFIKEVGRSPIRVVWTMHNRLPHSGDPEWGRKLYRAWAAVADGVIHHSHWGMELMRVELPYKPEAQHVIIPCGHFGEQMPTIKPRGTLERELGLKPCTMRFGVLGRPQKEKQVELITRAFHKGARQNQQLLVAAVTKDMELPDDPRIIPIYRKGWLSREEIACHVRVCDALVCAHTGQTYLTSGQVADAVGVGIPMLVGEWGFFREIMGDAAWYFNGAESDLAQLFGHITSTDIEAGKRASTALQHKYSWPLAAAKTLALFKKLG